MRISVLGPLRVETEAGEVTFSAAKERSLLKVLALDPGAVVSSDELISALWGDRAPAAARKTLQTYVWNVRKVLGDDALETVAPGYRLRLDPADVDVVRFRALIAGGERALREGDSTAARDLLGRAVELWRGDPCADVAAHTGLANEGVRLQQEHASALEARLSADLAEGLHREIVGELEQLVREHPFRERLWCHLMLALYRCGRQAEALDAYGRARQLLVEELGLEPGGELRRMEHAVIQQAPALDAPVLAPTGLVEDVVPTPVRYAITDDGVAVAYQTAGRGPVDILVVPGFVSHLDIWWNAPTDRLVRRLASVGRLISFDKRGMGLSDRPDRITSGQWVDDALAVLDSVESRQVVVLGVSCGALTALRLAHRCPERVRGLAFFGACARTRVAPDYEIGLGEELVDTFIDGMIGDWGTGVGIELYAPSRADDTEARAYWARYQRLSASPLAARRFMEAAADTDVRHLLPEVDVPSLVMHASRDVVTPAMHGEYLAEHLPRARFVPFDSDVHLMCLSDKVDQVTAEIEAFVGSLDLPRSEPPLRGHPELRERRTG